MGRLRIVWHRANALSIRAGQDIALVHRLSMEHRKPTAVSRRLDPAKQASFIKAYEDLLNHTADDEAMLFDDASIRRMPRSRSVAGGQRTPRSRWSRPAAARA